jgi:hypothetical protein
MKLGEEAEGAKEEMPAAVPVHSRILMLQKRQAIHR